MICPVCEKEMEVHDIAPTGTEYFGCGHVDCPVLTLVKQFRQDGDIFYEISFLDMPTTHITISAEKDPLECLRNLIWQVVRCNLIRLREEVGTYNRKIACLENLWKVLNKETKK